jgi:hypothetical protein
MTQLRPSSNAKMQSRRRVFIAILGFLFLGSVTGLTQTTTDGSIYGRVHDASGAVVAGAQIVAHSLSVGGEFKAVSDDVGDYRLKELPPAENYTLEVQQPGFDKYVRTGLVVEAGLSVTIDIPLKVGSQSQTVEVSGDAPLIETQSAEQSVNLSGDLLRNLPLSGRHEWSDALQVTPGIISA